MSGDSHKITSRKMLREKIMERISRWNCLEENWRWAKYSQQGKTCKKWTAFKLTGASEEKQTNRKTRKQCNERSQLSEAERFGIFHLKLKGYFSILHVCKILFVFKVKLLMLVLVHLQDTQGNMHRRPAFQWYLSDGIWLCNNYGIIYSYIVLPG